MNFHPYFDSSSSSKNPSKLKKILKPHLFYNLPTSNSKNQQFAKLRSKLPNLSALVLDSDTARLVSHRSTARKVLKYTSKVQIENSCKKLPIQMMTSLPNCRHYFLQSNNNFSQKGVVYVAKAINRTSSKHLQSMQISTMSPSNDKVNIKALFNLIASKRQLSNIKLTVNPSLSPRSLAALRRAFSGLHKLHTLSLITSNLSKDTASNNIPNPLGTIISNVKNLKNFYFKCFVTRAVCEELNNIVDKLAQTNRLEKIELQIHTADRLPITFYSLLSEKVALIRGLNAFGLIVDSFTNQRFNNNFFASLSRIKTLEKLIISANQLSINDKEMQGLFKTLSSLSRLKEFKFKAGGKAVNFSNDYYISFHEALSQMTYLEDLTYEIKNLGSNCFPHLFDRLPMFPRLRTLSLNITIGEGELGNVYFLSEFLKRTQNLKSLSLKINDGNYDMYVYQVPSEVFNILHEGLKAIPSLERFELSLGSIEDTGLNRILLTLNELRKLQSLKLDGFFHGITYQAFEGLCASLKRQKYKLKEVKVVPKQYPHSNMNLLHKVVNEIHSAKC